MAALKATTTSILVVFMAFVTAGHVQADGTSGDGCADFQFNVWNADTDLIYRQIEDGETFPVETWEFNVEAVPVKCNDVVKSMEIAMRGPINTNQRENAVPYMAFGDKYNRNAPNTRDILGRDWLPGEYKVTATAYSQRYNRGRVIDTTTIEFSVGDVVDPPTLPPRTEMPSTEMPSTEMPSTEMPSTVMPSTEMPSTETPSTEAPTAEPTDPLPPPCTGYLCLPPATGASIDEVIGSCPSAEVLDAIDEDFDIRFEFATDPAPEGDALRCTAAEGSRDLTQSMERAYQTLIALRAIEFDNPLPFTDKNMYEWMRDSIDGVRIRSDITTNFCCTPPPDKPGQQFINIVTNDSRSVFATDNWADNNGLGLFNQAQLFVHEARHTFLLHTCAGGNDQTIDELGAWGAVYYYCRALAFNSDPCFLQPLSGSFLPETWYLDVALDFSRNVHNGRFCSEPTVPVEPKEEVIGCAI